MSMHVDHNGDDNLVNKIEIIVIMIVMFLMIMMILDLGVGHLKDVEG